jgi:phenylalanyl-tRNA synthetase beta chain
MPGSDFAFVVDDTVAADAVIRAARGADKKLIVAVDLFDVFAGGSLGEGRKSLAIEVTLQPVERTLTDEEIDKVAKAIIAAVEKATGGTLRG